MRPSRSSVELYRLDVLSFIFPLAYYLSLNAVSNGDGRGQTRCAPRPHQIAIWYSLSLGIGWSGPTGLILRAWFLCEPAGLEPSSAWPTHRPNLVCAGRYYSLVRATPRTTARPIPTPGTLTCQQMVCPGLVCPQTQHLLVPVDTAA